MTLKSSEKKFETFGKLGVGISIRFHSLIELLVAPGSFLKRKLRIAEYL